MVADTVARLADEWVDVFDRTCPDCVPDASTVEVRGVTAVVCPTQTGDSKCSDCGLCFSREYWDAIAFVSHAALDAYGRPTE